MRKFIGTAAITLALFAPMAAQAQEAEVSANAGWVSQYYYRGLLQKTSSASAGLDVGLSNLYLGTWAADVADGAEVDLYAGFGVELDGGFSVSAGGTAYLYTGGFDDTYLEANLGAGYGPLSVEFSIGTYDTSPESLSYWFLGVTAEQSGFYGTLGMLGGEEGFINDEGDSGIHAEAGYGFSAGDLDLTISGIFADEKLNNISGGADSELTLVFGVSKAFEIN